jgi:hypothetical protein
MTIWRMRIAYWITKATGTHSEYVLVILIAFPRKQWLHERRSIRTLNVLLFTGRNVFTARYEQNL